MNILIINGHPNRESFNNSIAETYMRSALESGANVKHYRIGDMAFDMNLRHGYQKRMELEPDLLLAVEDIKWAEHLVWVFPIWWLGLPAKLKGFIDRAFLPGLTYIVEEQGPPTGLLKGRTAHIIATGDTPEAIFRSEQSSACLVQMEMGVFEPCGISLRRTTYIGEMAASEKSTREKWLQRIAEIAKEETSGI